MKSNPVGLYNRQYVDTGFERTELFELLSREIDARIVLYPGSFVHCTPSFFFPICVYVDSDRRAPRFFSSSTVRRFIEEHASYNTKPVIRFHYQSYENDIPEVEESFDLLISMYAGFVSANCTRYLKRGGYLVVNNSHGDASMAQLDERFELVGALHGRNDSYRLVSSNLDSYFVTKRPLEITPDYLRKINRGVAYTKPANYYLFQRLKRQ